MIHESSAASGELLEGFTAMLALAIWAGLVLCHGIWRSFDRPDADAIRPSGPI